MKKGCLNIKRPFFWLWFLGFQPRSYFSFTTICFPAALCLHKNVHKGFDVIFAGRLDRCFRFAFFVSGSSVNVCCGFLLGRYKKRSTKFLKKLCAPLKHFCNSILQTSNSYFKAEAL